MTIRKPLHIAALCAAMSAISLPAAAQGTDALVTSDEVRTEINEAMEAVASYAEQERDQALTEARQALTQLDAEIERREQALRESWSDMSDATRETARQQLHDLREARNRLGERYGALQAGASDAWDELKSGFSDAWTAFSKAWTDADGDMAEN